MRKEKIGWAEERISRAEEKIGRAEDFSGKGKPFSSYAEERIGSASRAASRMAFPRPTSTEFRARRWTCLGPHIDE